MPEEMERKLKAEAKSRGFSKERTGAYVFGTMRKAGWKPSTQMKGEMAKAKSWGKKHYA